LDQDAQAFEQAFTAEQYKDEQTSVDRLKHLLHEASIFNVFQEVWGEYEYRPHYKETKKARIDFLLTPKKVLLDAGWKYGAIGIECKKSNVKIGHPLSQIMDYSTAVFRHPFHTVLIKTDFIFLWPLEKMKGAIASLMAQNRFGSVHEERPDTNWHRLRFFCGEQKVLDYSFRQPDHISINPKISFGSKTGSR